MPMLLEVEGKLPEQVSNFDKVESTLRTLDCTGPHSFAILTRQDGSYIQVAGGRQKCLVEMRNQNACKHWRAYRSGLTGLSGAPQVIRFGGGEITLDPVEVFPVNDVISVFCAFFKSEPFPPATMWKDISEMFQDP